MISETFFGMKYDLELILEDNYIQINKVFENGVIRMVYHKVNLSQSSKHDLYKALLDSTYSFELSDLIMNIDSKSKNMYFENYGCIKLTEKNIATIKSFV